LEVGTKIDINNNGLLGEGKIERFYLYVGRIVGNFQFSIVPLGTLGLICPVREGANFFFWMYMTHVAFPCGCSIPVAELLYLSAFSAFAFSAFGFNALTLLVGRQEGHPACKN